MIYPEFLKDKGLIGVPAPSSGSEDEQKKNKYQHAIKYWESLGYSLILSKNLFKIERGEVLAKTRAKELNEMFEKDDIDCIICASGGEFLVEILPYINFELLKKHPKFVAGFSDPTGILFPLTTKYDIATIYGSNFSAFGVEKLNQNDKDFINVLTGKQKEVYSYPYYEEERIEKVTGLEPPNYTEKVEWKTMDNKDIEITGRIIGGCLDIISELAGTKYDGIPLFNKKYQKDGIIWYFDNCELSLEETIRTLWKLKEFHYFDYAKGVIFGRFGSIKTYFDYDVKSCLEDSVLNELDIPIIYDADISHKPPCIPIINGSIAHITCKKGKGMIEYETRN